MLQAVAHETEAAAEVATQWLAARGPGTTREELEAKCPVFADECRDHWDHPYELVEGATFGSTGTWLVCAGPDGEIGTEDDIRARIGDLPAAGPAQANGKRP